MVDAMGEAVRGSRPPVAIGPVVRAGGDGGTNRVTAEVDGVPVWFETADVPLAPRPEAFAASFLLAAQLHGRGLVLADPVDARWRRGAGRAASLAHQWWDAAPQGLTAPRRGRPGRGRRRAPGRARALCFTGGVDSFHSLGTERPTPDLLVLAIGYDIARDEPERSVPARSILEVAARSSGAIPVVITTNLRDHPLHRATDWGWVHGGPLAALGLVLTTVCSDLLVSASFSRAHQRPWGTHHELDPLWSSTDLRVHHVGDAQPREGKVADLAHDDLALAHLRVCWAHLGDGLNCGRCDKCLETLVMLHRAGALDRAVTFGPVDVGHLAGALDRLPETTYRRAYRRLLDGGLDGPVGAAVEQLLARTGPG